MRPPSNRGSLESLLHRGNSTIQNRNDNFFQAVFFEARARDRGKQAMRQEYSKR